MEARIGALGCLENSDEVLGTSRAGSSPVASSVCSPGGKWSFS